MRPRAHMAAEKADATLTIAHVATKQRHKMCSLGKRSGLTPRGLDSVQPVSPEFQDFETSSYCHSPDFYLAGSPKLFGGGRAF